MPTTPPLTKNFKQTTQEIADWIGEEGIIIRPFTHPSLPYFKVLTLEEQRKVLGQVHDFSQICRATRQDGGSLKINRKTVEKALCVLNLSAHKEDLDKIEPSHVVEIYDLTQMQIFRSFNYFEFLSYTLEDVYCRKWFHLYERTTADYEEFSAALNNFLDEKNRKTTRLHLREHKIKEVASLERLTFFNQTQWFVPLYRRNEFSAFMLLHISRLEH